MTSAAHWTIFSYFSINRSTVLAMDQGFYFGQGTVKRALVFHFQAGDGCCPDLASAADLVRRMDT